MLEDDSRLEHCPNCRSRRALRNVYRCGDGHLFCEECAVSVLKRKRCLIPVSGYYEWQDTASGKQPWYFTARDGSPALTIAGLWDEWKNPETGELLKSCTMIITEPNQFVAEVHDRMPVLLTQEQ